MRGKKTVANLGTEGAIQTGESKRLYSDQTPFVYVCTPAYDGKVDTDFSQSIANAAWHAFPFGIHPSIATMGNGAFIDLARNMFVAKFLNDPELKEATHFMFIDSDLGFQPNAFAGIIKSCTADRPVTAGVYRRRQEDVSYPAVWTPHPTEKGPNGEDCIWIDDDGFMKHNRVPTGFLCIRRNILEEMAVDAVQLNCHDFEYNVPKLFYTKYIEDEDGRQRMVGEDFAWCDDYIERYNQPIDVWPDFDFIHGGYECNYAQWLSEKIEDFDVQTKLEKGPRKMGDRRRKRRA